ncbi:hypothetical protein TUSST3_16920 [Streptomyces sp. TUS-ST3]|nr:hypothetical protein TUSST3_16920 [Streptomyces sp. TUS-ST3]
MINGILFRQRTGVPWRDLPARFGRWKTVYERHRRWSADGTWDKPFAAVLADADAEGRIDWSMVSWTPPPAGPTNTLREHVRNPRGFREKTHAPAAPPR